MNDEPPPSGSPSDPSDPSDPVDRVHVELSHDETLPCEGLPDAAFFARFAALAIDADADGDGDADADADADAASPAVRCDVSVRLVDEDEGRRLNRDWRAVDRATNVLSFASDLPPLDDARLLGDLVFCAPLVLAEACAQGKSANAHWAHLTVHGTLHLLGHDHEDDEAADAMEALETALLARAGIADPYRPDVPAHAGARS